jgi:hypothetical protein
MTNELTTTAAAIADLKESAPKRKLLIMWIAFLCGLIAVAAYNLAHHQELWSVIAEGQRF